MKNKRILYIFLGIISILIVPLIAMQFSDEVNWSLSDFVIIGVLLSAAGFTFEMMMRKTKNFQKRVLFGGAILLVVMLIWAELAVGVFGSPLEGS